VVTAGLREDIPLRTGTGFRLRIGIHDQIATKEERGGFMFLLHDVIEAEGETFGSAKLGLNVRVRQVDDAGGFASNGCDWLGDGCGGGVCE
jgi:hypothetical protein